MRFFATAVLRKKRWLSLPVSTMWQWCVSRSSSAVVIFASPNTLDHSAKSRLLGDHHAGVLVQPAQQMEQQCTAGLAERQVALQRLGHRARRMALGWRLEPFEPAAREPGLWCIATVDGLEQSSLERGDRQDLLKLIDTGLVQILQAEVCASPCPVSYSVWRQA